VIFKDHLSKTKKDNAIWKEHLRQPEGKGWKIRNDMIQDAEFFTEDRGPESADTPHGDDAKKG